MCMGGKKTDVWVRGIKCVRDARQVCRGRINRWVKCNPIYGGGFAGVW